MMEDKKGSRERVRIQSVNDEPSLTRQSEAEGQDIHNILDRYRDTGLLPVRDAQPLQGALPDVADFHDAMNKVAFAQQAFDGLPSDIRQQFDNDAGKFLAFCGNPDNKEKMIELGLADKEPSQKDVDEIAAAAATQPQPEPEPAEEDIPDLA